MSDNKRQSGQENGNYKKPALFDKVWYFSHESPLCNNNAILYPKHFFYAILTSIHCKRKGEGIILSAIRQKIYNLVRDDDENSLAANIFDGIIIFFIVINVLLVILETFKGYPKWVTIDFHYVDVISVTIFTIEYLLRLWTATYIYPDVSPLKARIKYAFSIMAIVDLLAILPLYMPNIFPFDLRVLRLIRLLNIFRIFKVNHYTTALFSVRSILSKKFHQLVSSMLVVAVLMVTASVLMYNIESEAQPDKFNNAFSGLWWAVVTVTTVGYGDIYPVTVPGKILSSVIALLGIGIVAVPTGIISSGFVERIVKEDKYTAEMDKEEKHYCPYCGKKLD